MAEFVSIILMLIIMGENVLYYFGVQFLFVFRIRYAECEILQFILYPFRSRNQNTMNKINIYCAEESTRSSWRRRNEQSGLTKVHNICRAWTQIARPTASHSANSSINLFFIGKFLIEHLIEAHTRAHTH